MKERYKEPVLYFTDENNKNKGELVGGFIFNYVPPTPDIHVHRNKPLKGFSTFQEAEKHDTKINFTIGFMFDEKDEDLRQKQTAQFLDFRKRYNEWFWFEDEFGVLFKGKIVKKFDIKVPEQFEGETYYIDIELLCPCSLDGWKNKDEGKVNAD
ncbi:hypothetical protein [Clostridium botulinum]|uniref:hypothetical protein n=1 Tax=Clostridium botulinum TaxID=1491 RepID=UPI001E365A69|nr:hypothetical protein [Clostridium botulinum]MCD3223781.1 hypothetical protein [Clostridium botulinum C/D]MCD3297159.1 hypothetical protein [Clostridium botulinum C/D]